MKVINIIKNIILDILIVLLVGVIIFGFINKNKPVPIFGYYFFNVLTGSMQPTLKVGDNVIVKKQNEYKVGDIISYKMNDIYVTHRIVKIEGDMITTKGDANDVEDPPFNKSKILGKYVFKSIILNFIINNKFLIAFIILVFFVIDMILDSKKKVKKNDD